MKNAVYSFSLLLLLTLPSFGQGRFSVAPTYSFIYGHLDYRFNQESSSYTVNGPSYGSTAGLTSRYHITPKLDVSVGLLYNKITDYRRSESNSALGTPGNYTYVSKRSTDTRTSDHFQFPVLINYATSSNRLSPYLSVGALFDYQLGQFDQGTIKTSGLVAAGIKYRINPNLSLVVQPTGSYLFEKNFAQKFRSYQVGLQTQLVWRF